MITKKPARDFSRTGFLLTGRLLDVQREVVGDE